MILLILFMIGLCVMARPRKKEKPLSSYSYMSKEKGKPAVLVTYGLFQTKDKEYYIKQIETDKEY